jgi:hypothetical protein
VGVSNTGIGASGGNNHSEYAQELVPFKCLRLSSTDAHASRVRQARHDRVQQYDEKLQESDMYSKAMAK